MGTASRNPKIPCQVPGIFIKPDPCERPSSWYRQRSLILRDGRVFVFQHADETYLKEAIPILITSGKELFAYEFEPSFLDRIFDWWRGNV